MTFIKIIKQTLGHVFHRVPTNRIARAQYLPPPVIHAFNAKRGAVIFSDNLERTINESLIN